MAAEPKKMVVEGWLAREVWQHMVQPQPGLQLQYVDTVTGGQLVVYVKEKLPEGEVLRLEGHELVLEGRSKRPGSSTPFTERQLVVETWARVKDPSLDALAAALPKGWKLSLSPPRLTLERDGEVWVLRENRINAAPERPEARRARIKANGTKTSCRLVFKLAQAWTAEERAKALATNTQLDAELAALDARTGVKPGAKGPLGPPGDAGVSWQKERSTLEQKRVVLPDAQSAHFALFLLESEGLDGESVSVEPASAAQETFQVLERVRALK